MTDQFYHCFDNYPSLNQLTIQEGSNAVFTETYYPHVYKANCSFSNSNFIKTLKQNLGQITALWLQNPPNTLYDWHIDYDIRQCSINFEIKENNNAMALFREPINKSKIYYNVHKVKYVIGKPTVLNVKNHHCVLNNSNEPRIILSLCVHQSSYKETVDYMKTLNISDY